MEKTFKEFMLECQYYHHSQESYDIMRECAELALMEKYIEDHKFYDAHLGEFAESMIAEGYFGESVDIGSIEVLTEKARAKKGNLMSRLMQAMLKLITGFWKFTGKMANAFDQTTADAAAIVKALNSQVLSDEKVRKITELAGLLHEKCPGFEPHEEQPFISSLKITPVTGQVDDIVIRYLAAGLADKKAVAKVGLLGRESTIGALPIDTLRSAAVKFCSKNPYTMGAAVKELTATWSKIQIDGLEIPVIPKEIERASNQLKQVKDMIEQGLNNVSGGAQFLADVTKGVAGAVTAGVNAAKADQNPQNGQGQPANSGVDVNAVADNVSAAVMQAAEKLRGMVQASIGASMSVYADYSKYRKMCISTMKTILTTKDGDITEQNSGDPAGNAQPAGA